MASKLSQVLVFLAAVTATLQSKLVSDDDANILSHDGLENIVKHLKTHAYPSHDKKPYLASKQRSTANDPSSLLNIQTLNLYVKGDETKKILRSGVEQEPEPEQEDRICKTGRCGCKGDRCNDREEDQGQDREEKNEVQQILDELERELDKDSTRCAKNCVGRKDCGCDNRNDRGEDGKDLLRCKYGRCGKTRSGNSFKSQLEQYGKKYKISDDLDAIVVDISNFKGLLGKLNGRGDRNQDRDVDMDYFYGDARSTDDRNDDGELDAVVLNMGQGKKDQDIVSQVVKDLLYKTKQKTERDYDPIRPNELADFFEAKKQRVIENALNFVTNSRGYKDLSMLSKEQQFQLQKVRSEVQRRGARSNLKEVEKKVLDIVLGDGIKSEVLPHHEKNNNVYIPKWVYGVLKESRDLRSKSLFPLTNKQKLKMYKGNYGNESKFVRRNLQKNEKQVGVPFQLLMQGLGQINP